MKFSILVLASLKFSWLSEARPQSHLQVLDASSQTRTVSSPSSTPSTKRITVTTSPSSKHSGRETETLSSRRTSSSSTFKETSSFSSHTALYSTRRTSRSISLITSSAPSTHNAKSSSHIKGSSSSHSSSPTQSTSHTTSSKSKAAADLMIHTSLSANHVESSSPSSSQISIGSSARRSTSQTSQSSTSVRVAASSEKIHLVLVIQTSSSKQTQASQPSQTPASLTNITVADTKHLPAGVPPSDDGTLLTANATIEGDQSKNLVSTDDPWNSSLKLSPETTHTNETGPCRNGIFLDEACFNKLDLTGFVQWWWSRHEKVCASQNIAFAQCFYAIETPYAPSNCAEINDNAACTQPIWQDFKHLRHGVEKFYVAWNLWNTAGFFLDMWIAIGAAEASCQGSLASIVNLLDPPKDQTMTFDYILDALTFGMGLYAEGSVLLKALIRSIPQTSGLTGKLFPKGTVDGEYQDWSVVAANIGKFTDAFRKSVADNLPLIQNNVTTFVRWAQVAGLSGNRPPLHGLAENMTQALNTYAISRILTTQGIILSRAVNTDVHALQTNGSQLNWDTGCGAGYDNVGLCDTFFWDGKDTYGLTDPDQFTRSYHDELESFFNSSGSGPSLTTGNLLFSGSQRCYEATRKNGGSDPVLSTTDVGSNLCLSSVPVCTWDMDSYGPFDNSCKNLPDQNAVLPTFGITGCRGEIDSTTSINVPRAYLGPGIYADKNSIPDLQRYDFCNDVDL